MFKLARYVFALGSCFLAGFACFVLWKSCGVATLCAPPANLDWGAIRQEEAAIELTSGELALAELPCANCDTSETHHAAPSESVNDPFAALPPPLNESVTVENTAANTSAADGCGTENCVYGNLPPEGGDPPGSPIEESIELAPPAEMAAIAPPLASVLVAPVPCAPSTGQAADGCTSSSAPLQCEIVDRDSGAVVASFKISEPTDITLHALPAAESESPSVADVAPKNPQNRGGAYAPFLDLRIDLDNGSTLIDARNLPVKDLVQAMEQRYHFPIRTEANPTEVVSARIIARDPITALRRLLEPVGYRVITESPQSWVVRAAPAGTTRLARTAPSNAPRTRIQNRSTGHLSAPSSQTAIQLASHSEQAPPDVCAMPRESQSSVDLELAAACEALIQQGRGAEAIERLTGHLVDYPASCVTAKVLALAYVARGDLAAAFPAATEAIRLDRNDPAANRLMGTILNEMGQEDRGRHYLAQARYLESQSE